MQVQIHQCRRCGARKISVNGGPWHRDPSKEALSLRACDPRFDDTHDWAKFSGEVSEHGQ